MELCALFLDDTPRKLAYLAVTKRWSLEAVVAWVLREEPVNRYAYK
jgi:hypothetical protein